MTASAATGDLGARRALVLGLGRFGGGRAAATFLLRRGLQVVVADRALRESLEASVERLSSDAASLGAADRLEFALGQDSPDLDGIDLVVVNPAIPNQHGTLALARELGVPTTQELDLFLDAFPGRVLLVTGTNGKSSITSALGSVLRTAGLRVLVGGNIGHSLLDDVESWSADTVAVVEASSFQLERMRVDRTVLGAVLAPITVDHLDRHGTLDAYRAAKARAAEVAGSFLIHGADDEVAAGFETRAETRLVHASGPGTADAFVDEDGFLCLAGSGTRRRLVHRNALRRLGEVQVRNLCAVALAADRCSAPTDRLGLGLALAEPLPYRLRELRPIGSVRVFDDSVATSVLATRSGLETLLALPGRGPIHWVTGGVAKCADSEIPGLADQLLHGLDHPPDRIHVFGRVAGPFGEALRDRGLRVSCHETPIEALEAALAEASTPATGASPIGRPGPSPALLFSPAFASFDQFPNFEARARAFLGWHRRRTAD